MTIFIITIIMIIKAITKNRNFLEKKRFFKLTIVFGWINQNNWYNQPNFINQKILFGQLKIWLSLQ